MRDVEVTAGREGNRHPGHARETEKERTASIGTEATEHDCVEHAADAQDAEGAKDEPWAAGPHAYGVEAIARADQMHRDE